MAFSRPNRDKQVRLTVFDNEPLARLAEQRLLQAGIPCFIRSLRGGPGLWGSAYNLPHDLYVYASDESPAREVLDLAPPESTDDYVRESPGGVSQRRWAALAGALIFTLVLLLVISVFDKAG